ncbi:MULTISPECIES: NAD+ synthase [Aphanothece]|uniref:NAD+ synthase n=1 Tax=Aphanothece TaxID=1121 RepID=UPI003984F2F8
MRLALAQINPLVGDLAGNGERILAACRQAASRGADLVLTPELSLWGYPPRDLLLQPTRLTRQQEVLEAMVQELARTMPELALLVGIAEPKGGGQLPNLFNAVALVEAAGWRVVARKLLLPTYDVFDEQRYFLPGDAAAVLELERRGQRWRLGLTICEDLWVEEELQGHRLAGPDPVAALLPSRVDLLLNLSASPFGQAKVPLRHALARRAARRLNCPVVYVNQVGGNDELVFDGASFVVEACGELACQLACCTEDLKTWSPGRHPAPGPPADAVLPEPLEQLFRALVLGVRDYAGKCGFQRALLGLSGGIDSALVAVIATAALGAEQVRALLMPSPWSSSGATDDALALAGRLGLITHTLPITGLMAGFDTALTPALGQPPSGLTAENLQSRIRGTLLMAVANQQGRLLLSTGNKSELAVGYCTLYGDMNGGLAVIGDVYKTSVFTLAAWLDSPAALPCRRSLGLPERGELIGAAIRHKPPSAELRPDQRDTDSLPDYGELDPLLRALVEERRSQRELVAEGTDPELAERVSTLLRRAEFKRRQAPPVLKVSGHAFDSGWRMPIAAG